MKYCNSCNVSVDVPLEHCPLCYTNLTITNNEPMTTKYPDVLESTRAYNLAIKILLLVSFTVVLISLTVNFLTSVKFPWSLIVLICIVYVWIALGTAIRKRHRIGYNLMIQLISIALLLLVLSYLLNFQRVFFNYLLPALTTCAILSYNVLAVVMRKELKSLLLYYLIIDILAFVPIVLYAAGIVSVRWPAFGCAVYSLISIVSVFIFAYRDTKNELTKRFHL